MLGLLLQELILVIVLCQDCPSHLKLSSVITHVCVFLELIAELVLAHLFLDSVYNLNDVLDILFKQLPFLKTRLTYQIGLLVSQCIDTSNCLFPISRAFGVRL